jgi:serine/threonine protein kinase/WD40 repeat protein
MRRMKLQNPDCKKYLIFLVVLFLSSSFLTSAQQSPEFKNSDIILESNTNDAADWLDSDSDNDGIDNGHDVCPYWKESNCSIMWTDTNYLNSKLIELENQTITDIEFSPGGEYIAVASRDYGVIVLNSVSYEVEKYFPLNRGAESVAFSNNGLTLAIFGGDGLLQISTHNWEVGDVDMPWVYSEMSLNGADLVFSPSDYEIAIAANHNITTGYAYIWDRLDGRVTAQFQIESNGNYYEKVNAIDYSKDGHFLALAQGNQFAIYATINWDEQMTITNENLSSEKTNCQWRPDGCANYALDLEFSKDGKYLAVSLLNSSIEIYSTNMVCGNCISWQLLTEKSIYNPEAIEYPGIAFSPDSQKIISILDDSGVGLSDYDQFRIMDIYSGRWMFIDSGCWTLGNVAISPSGKQIAFSGDDDCLEWNFDGETMHEPKDGTGIFSIEIDYDNDGIRDLVDECVVSEQGNITDENGCVVIIGSGAESVDDNKIGGVLIFTSIIASLLAFVKYSQDNEESWILLTIIALIIMIFLPIATIESNVESIPGHDWIMQKSCDEASSECWKNDGINDNSQYREGLMFCFLIGVFGIIIGTFLVAVGGTPGMIIGGLFIFVGIVGGTFLWLWGTFVLGLLEIFAGNPYWIVNLFFLIISGLLAFGASPTVGVASTFTPASKSSPVSVASSSPAVNPSPGKIDHEEIKRLVRQYSDDDDVFWHYTQSRSSSVKESSLKNAIKHRRGEYKKEMSGRKQVKRSSKQSKPTLVSQASSKPMARESASAKQNYPSVSTPKIMRNVKKKVNKIIVPSTSQPMDLNTNVLANNSYSEPQEKKSKITTDSSGITTITTEFSIVTLNKLTDEVTKVPRSTEQHEMFYQEIKNMKHLESKGFDVGLIDYDDGSNPKIVTRYMGPSKLAEQYQTLNNRGKKKLIVDLVEEVAQIHKSGMVHRDLKPDNILIDARPRDGNHQFDAIIDFGIAMKINRKQSEIYNTAGTKFFGHSSQKDVNFNASTGQDWFSLARIFALILRGKSIDSLNAEIQMSQNGLNMRNEIKRIGFNDKVVDSMTELIIQSTNSKCEQPSTVKILEKIGTDIVKNL